MASTYLKARSTMEKIKLSIEFHKDKFDNQEIDELERILLQIYSTKETQQIMKKNVLKVKKIMIGKKGYSKENSPLQQRKRKQLMIYDSDESFNESLNKQGDQSQFEIDQKENEESKLMHDNHFDTFFKDRSKKLSSNSQSGPQLIQGFQSTRQIVKRSTQDEIQFNYNNVAKETPKPYGTYGLLYSPRRGGGQESNNTTVENERLFKFRQDTELNETESKLAFTPLDKTFDLKESDMLKERHAYNITDQSEQKLPKCNSKAQLPLAVQQSDNWAYLTKSEMTYDKMTANELTKASKPIKSSLRHSNVSQRGGCCFSLFSSGKKPRTKSNFSSAKQLDTAHDYTENTQNTSINRSNGCIHSYNEDMCDDCKKFKRHKQQSKQKNSDCQIF